MKSKHLITLFAVLLSAVFIFTGAGLGMADASCTGCHSIHSQVDQMTTGINEIAIKTEIEEPVTNLQDGTPNAGHDQTATVTNAHEGQYCEAPSAQQGLESIGTTIASTWNGAFYEGNGTTHHHSQAWQIDAAANIGMAGNATASSTVYHRGQTTIYEMMTAGAAGLTANGATAFASYEADSIGGAITLGYTSEGTTGGEISTADLTHIPGEATSSAHNGAMVAVL